MKGPDHSPPADQASNRRAAWLVFRNTSVLAVGRNLNTAARLIIVVLIARLFGVDVFGAYSLLIAVMTIAEWLLDFGSTDVFVREAMNPARPVDESRRLVFGLKLVQIPLAVLCFLIVLMALAEGEAFAVPVAIAAVSLAVFGGVVGYRAMFRATMNMQYEVFAEFISILVMIPAVWVVAVRGGGLTGLMAAHLLSRVVFLAACWVFSRGLPAIGCSGITGAQLVAGLRACFAIGLIGLLVVLNNTLEIVLLSAVATVHDVAIFSAAQKFAMPLLMVLNALGTAAYPVLAATWQQQRDRFDSVCQRIVDANCMLAALGATAIVFGAESIMRLLGDSLVPGAPALRLLVVAYVVKSLAMVIGPVLYVVHKQWYGLWYFSAALAIKAILISWLGPTYGFFGVALITLFIEAALITPITLFYVARFTRYRLKPWRVVAIVSSSLLSLVLTRLLLPWGSLLGAGVALGLNVLLLGAFGPFGLASLRQGYRFRHED